MAGHHRLDLRGGDVMPRLTTLLVALVVVALAACGGQSPQDQAEQDFPLGAVWYPFDCTLDGVNHTVSWSNLGWTLDEDWNNVRPEPKMTPDGVSIDIFLDTVGCEELTKSTERREGIDWIEVVQDELGWTFNFTKQTDDGLLWGLNDDDNEVPFAVVDDPTAVQTEVWWLIWTKFDCLDGSVIEVSDLGWLDPDDNFTRMTKGWISNAYHTDFDIVQIEATTGCEVLGMTGVWDQ